jgi:hypothetical protein
VGFAEDSWTTSALRLASGSRVRVLTGGGDGPDEQPDDEVKADIVDGYVREWPA